MVKERIAEVLGDQTVGIVNGRDAVYYERVNQFNASAFQKEYPDMYRIYVHPVMKNEFDAEMLKSSRPDLYERYQVRKMRVVYEAPGVPDLPEMPERQF